MLAIVIGTLLILGGLGWAVLAFFAAGMASRSPTRGEELAPLLGLIPVVLGIAILIWG